jgi:Ribosomal protein L7/L12 C-terminal domain
VGDLPGERSSGVIGGMIRRALPRLTAVVLLCAAGTFLAEGVPEVVASSLRPLGSVLACYALGSREWWRYVRHGKPPPWRVDHGGAIALFVTDPGRDRFEVVAALQAHGGLDSREASDLADDPSRPVWDDLTSESADRLRAVLAEAGATVSVRPRSRPPWARDVSGR